VNRGPNVVFGQDTCIKLLTGDEASSLKGVCCKTSIDLLVSSNLGSLFTRSV